MAMPHRNGKALKVLQDGHPRRLADGRNAWKKMNQEQREAFLRDVVLTDQESIDLALRVADLIEIDENESAARKIDQKLDQEHSTPSPSVVVPFDDYENSLPGESEDGHQAQYQIENPDPINPLGGHQDGYSEGEC